METVRLFVEWILAVIEHWELIVASGAIAFVLDLIDKFWDWKMPKKFYAIFISIGLFLAMFAAWREQVEKNKAAAVYLVADQPSPVVEAVDKPFVFPVGRPMQINQTWGVFGQLPALHAKGDSRCYLADDTNPATQFHIIQQFKELILDAMKTRSTESPNIFPGNNHYGGTCKADGILSADDRNAIKYGKKFVFAVAAMQFMDSTGNHEAHACRWLETHPTGQQDFWGTLAWHECNLYTTLIDISDP